MTPAQAYKALVSRLADLEPNIGWTPATFPEYIPDTFFFDNELALICEHKPQEFADECVTDPALLARYLRDELDANTYRRTVREAWERAAAEAIWPDVSEECARRAEQDERDRLGEDAYVATRYTTPEGEHGEQL